MKNVLIVSGHTDLEDSVANRTILEIIAEKEPQIAIDRLDSLYGKDFRIDVAAEQAKLEAADVIVLQFPIFWYAMPSLLKRWLEETLVHGWSHGSTGHALRGRKLVVSLTTGAPEEAYSHDGATGHTIEEFCSPIAATCGLTGMELAGIVHTSGVSYQARTDEAALNRLRERAADHAERLLDLVRAL